tara:strand:- start:17010 stop:17579 length:570 start_codon:yes stop_codon:yes gene_type:complete
MNVSEMTHDDIADFAAERLRTMGYKFTCSNLTSRKHREQPDALGINTKGRSILVEVKTSRADFFADKKKPFREKPSKGIGDIRVYLTTKGLVKPEEVPYGWMLWEVHGKAKPTLKVIKGKAKNIVKMNGKNRTEWTYVNCDEKEYLYMKRSSRKNYQKEVSWLMKIITRAMADGFEPNDYANNYQKNKK